MMYAEEIAFEAGLARIQVGVRMSLPGNVALYKSLGYELIAVEPHPKGPDLIGTLVKPVGD
jgi:ribosomal protein S18 acetylase RimI-like enzyme